MTGLIKPNVSLKWDERYVKLASHIAGWSKDPSAQIGAVIVSPELGRIISVGFNGFPINIEDSEERLDDTPEKLKMVIHAEENAILFAGRAARDCHIYVVGKPVCVHCALLIIQSRITRVVAVQPDFSVESKWNETGEKALMLFNEAGVEFTDIDRRWLA
ncbi:MAG: deoxycytidylate deaminase [Proteobacteria bacterium]|nr:deoxycytidylate deaminase [Pseudomonadota bacterium]